MPEQLTLKHLTAVFTDILQIITDRYVKDELVIPKDVLALKDEACDIIGKAADETRGAALMEYGRRLVEIHRQLS
ncbi:MAG: hypothetical protein K2N56_05070 [Oscillospiraceae bacterium]|nr:hypothetical protein [Oscillospiraceae bacterium]